MTCTNIVDPEHSEQVTHGIGNTSLTWIDNISEPHHITNTHYSNTEILPLVPLTLTANLQA